MALLLGAHCHTEKRFDPRAAISRKQVGRLASGVVGAVIPSRSRKIALLPTLLHLQMEINRSWQIKDN